MPNHYYMRDHIGGHCIHYSRGSESYWHRCNAYPRETAIFNYGCSSSGCCSGFSTGRTFWSGLGAGIGLGLGNLFGGFFGGFMMPFFGGGLFGGMFGMPMFSNYGMVPNYVSSFTPTYTPVKTGNPASPASPSNPSNPSDPVTPTPDATAKDVDELKARAGKIDEKSTHDDIQKLIDEMQAKINGGTLSSTDKTDLESTISTLKAQKLVAEISSKTITDLTDENLELLIKEKDNLNDAQKTTLQNLLKEKLEPLKLEANKLGTVTGEDTYKCSNDYKTLLMLELSGFNVRAEHWVGKGDQYITGPISKVEKDGNIITYKINCSETGECIKGKWTFEQSSATSCRPTHLEEPQCDCEFNDKARYTWNENDGCWDNTDPNNPSARKKSK